EGYSSDTRAILERISGDTRDLSDTSPVYLRSGLERIQDDTKSCEDLSMLTESGHRRMALLPTTRTSQDSSQKTSDRIAMAARKNINFRSRFFEGDSLSPNLQILIPKATSPA